MSRFREETLSSGYASGNYAIKISTTYGNCTTSPSGMSFITNYVGNYLSNKVYRNMTDELTPGFHAIKRSGGIVNSPMTSYRIDESKTVGPIDYYLMAEAYGCTPARWYDYAVITVTGNRDYLATIPFLAHGLSAATIAAQKDLAVTSAWAAVDKTDFLAYVSLLESGKTVNGLLDIFRKVLKIAIAVKRMQLKVLLKELHPRELKDVYMNARYNLRPLYYECQGLYKAITAKKRGNRQTYRGSNVVSNEVTDTTSFSINDTGNGFNVLIPVVRRTKIELTCRAGVLTEWDVDNIGQRLGLDSLVSSAWELIPYSFIIDWFINVGDTIMSWTPNIGGRTLASWICTDTIITDSLVVQTPQVTRYTGSSGRRASSSSYCSYSGTHARVQRTRTREVSPRRAFLPTMSVRLNPLKLIDLGIILANLRKGSSNAYRI